MACFSTFTIGPANLLKVAEVESSAAVREFEVC